MFPQHLGAYVDSKLGVANTTLTEGSTESVTGSAIDRQEFYSGVLNVVGTSDSSNANDVTLDIVVRDCATSGGTYEDYATTSVTLGSAGETKLAELDVDLKGAKQYLKVEIDGAAGMTDASTDTVDVAASLILGGSVEKPV